MVLASMIRVGLVIVVLLAICYYDNRMLVQCLCVGAVFVIVIEIAAYIHNHYMQDTITKKDMSRHRDLSKTHQPDKKYMLNYPQMDDAMDARLVSANTGSLLVEPEKIDFHVESDD
jgi:hypothetical protein